MTPVLVAASHGAWLCVAELLKNGASILHRDDNKRNLLHLIINIGGKPGAFQDHVSTKVINR